ncbi:site-specific integrase [Paracoccaceae bacterium]|nr:site-specific integrase [Paracoccaceae bacterium]
MSAISAKALFFTNQDNKLISRNTISQLCLNTLVCAAQLVTNPRHRSILILANKGMGVRVLGKFAGHASVAVTQRYIDVNDTQLAQAVELV